MQRSFRSSKIELGPTRPKQGRRSVKQGLPVQCRRALHAVLLTAGVPVCASASALAQSPADKYPDKPIKIIVPFAPGGSTDILARVIGQKMTESWGQTVIVETRP